MLKLIGLMTSFVLGAMPSAAQQAPVSDTARSLAFRGVTVIDVTSGQRLPDQTVVIVGNRIQVMGNRRTVKTPLGAQVVNARGKYLIPGLWDMHIHPDPDTMADVVNRLLLANGITGFRNAGSDIALDSLHRWHADILKGTRVGPPRQLITGPALSEKSICVAGDSGCIPQGDIAAARRAVEALNAAGVDHIKTYSLSDPMYFVVVGAARRAGLRVGGHTAPPATMAADSGARLFDHSGLNNELATACFFGAASVAACRPIAAHLVQHNAWWVPTWVTPPHFTGARSAPLYHGFNAFVRRFWADSVVVATLVSALPAALREDGAAATGPPSDTSARKPPPHGADVPDTAGYLYVARNAGLPILAGTDATGDSSDMRETPPGFSLHTELASYVAEGLTPLEALRTATLGPAQYLHATDSLGTVAVGKLADLVLLDADPLVDITNTATVRAVVANGRYFDRMTLDRLVFEAWRMARGH